MPGLNRQRMIDLRYPRATNRTDSQFQKGMG